MNLGGTVRLNPLGVCILLGIGALFFLYMNSWSSSNDLRNVSTDVISLKKLLMKSVEAAILGGEEVRKVQNGQYLNQMSKGKTEEGANDPVTNADLMSHCVMFQTLIRAFPGIKIISEEKPQQNCKEFPSKLFDGSSLHNYNAIEDETVNAEDVTVWIDPLDATQEFIEKLLQYVTTMVCIAVKGIPTIGVIHQPFRRSKTTWAWTGHAKSADIVLDDQITLEKHIVVSRSHAGKVRNITLKAFGNDFNVIPAGGAGYKVLEVVNGNASAYIHVTAIKKWDVCAGEAILRSVGGHMTTISGNQLDYSANASTVNKDGLLATLQEHNWYSKHLQKFYQKIEEK